MPDEITTNFSTFPQGSVKKRKLPILIIVILITLAVIAAGFFGWKLYQKYFAKVTYNNARYGYSLKYPKSWTVNSSRAEKDFTDGAGGELNLSNYPNPLDQLEFENLPTDLETMTVAVYKINATTTAEQFIIEKIVGFLPSFSQRDVTFAGLDGKQLIYVLPADKKEILSIQTFLKKDTNMFVFSFNAFKPENSKIQESVQGVNDAIIKSFQAK